MNYLYLVSESWTIPQVTGESPQPCSNLSMTSIDSNRAIMFGGFQAEGGRVNDVYIAELSKETLVSISIHLMLFICHAI